jgi:polysaccharide pyruvyl transferase WcaK-like protein
MPSPKNIVFIVGDFTNIGDQFLSYVEAQYAMKTVEYNEIVICPWNDASLDEIRWFGNRGLLIKPIRNSPLRFLLGCMGAKINLGGGQFVREQVSFGFLITTVLGIVIASWSGGSVRMVGAGSSKIHSYLKRWAWRNILKYCSFIGMRDASSVNQIKTDFPDVASRVFLTSDVAFLSDQLIRRNKSSVYLTKICLVALAYDLGEDRQCEPELVINLIAKLSEAGLIDRVCFIAHDNRAGLDLNISKQVEGETRELLNLPTEIVEYSNIDDLLNAYRQSAVIITARLHGLIIGAIYRKPVITIFDATQKMKPFGDSFGYPAISVAFKDNSSAYQEDLRYATEYVKAFSPVSLDLALTEHFELAAKNFLIP